MKRFVRYGLRTVAVIAAILLIIWLVLLIYVNLNEGRFIKKISDAVKERTHGEVRIDDLSVSLFRTFPVISLQLSGVLIRDSLHARHQKDLFQAGDIYLRLSIASLLRGEPALGRVVIRNGSIHLYTDTAGVSNRYVFRSDSARKTPSKPQYFDIVLINTMLTYEDLQKFKFHQAAVNTLRCKVDDLDATLRFHIRLKGTMNSLAFNTNKGSFVKGKYVDGNFSLVYDKNKKDLVLDKVRLDFDKHPYHFNGRFHLDSLSPDYNLRINTYNIMFDNAVSALTDTMQSRLNSFTFNKKINIAVELRGRTSHKYQPAARIITEIDLQSANNFGSDVFDLVKGKADLDVTINGPKGGPDSLIGKIEGDITIADAEIRYLPRNFTFRNLEGKIKLSSKDLIVEKLNGQTGGTKLEMQGVVKDFFSSLNKEPGKMDAVWKISSPAVNLEDFKAFLASPAAKRNARKKKGETMVSARVDRIFSEGDIYVLLESPVMRYKTFKANAVKADVVMKKSELAIQNIVLKHANGTMEVQGKLTNGVAQNPVSLHTRMRDMEIPLLFAAFDNFGQDAVTYKNLKGRLSADIHYNTAITNKAELVSSASEGTINFILEDGELNNFEPLQEIGKKVFKKQDFSSINFATLQNRLDVRGTAFIINEMDIRSSALNFTVEGVYDIKKGTDMAIKLPVRNLISDQSDTDLADGAKAKKGVSLRLRARTGEDGKLKISWDPFRRAKKNKQDLKDSADIDN